MKSGMDRVNYFLDQTVSASAVKFQILEYNAPNAKVTRMDVFGCLYEGTNNGLNRCQKYEPVIISLF